MENKRKDVEKLESDFEKFARSQNSFNSACEDLHESVEGVKKAVSDVLLNIVNKLESWLSSRYAKRD
jgi:predicted  nucleic acid-binding Zn-ribbon protein